MSNSESVDLFTEPMNRIAILIVIYGKDLKQSTTVNYILNEKLPDANLTIINNGPNLLDCDRSILESLNLACNSVVIKEFIENRPLSKIYNQFIKDNSDSDYFVIFDDDSVPQKKFFENITKATADLLLPKIFSVEDNKLYYPIQNKSVITEFGDVEIDGIMSISSGLTFSAKLTKIYERKYGDVFDERFALYGIDTSFFIRLSDVNKAHPDSLTAVCENIINHSLSRVNQKLNTFRLTERTYDMAITARNYPEFISSKDIVLQAIKLLLKLKFKCCFILLKTYSSGKHPRC
jgi:hypothetical protein